MAAAEGRMVCLGVVTAAHGVRGEVRIRTFTARAEDLVAYGDLYDEHGMRRFEVRRGGSVRGAVVARIAGVEDRDGAERLRGLKLYVPRAILPEPEPEEYYHADLIGLRAEIVAAEDADRAKADVIKSDDGSRPALGPVTAVDDFGAGPVLEITVAIGPPLMVPFTRAVVPWVDLEAGRIGIVAVPGLLAGPGREALLQPEGARQPAPADR